MKSKNDKLKFIGIDGEGITLPDGSHLYTLLCNSLGQSVYNPEGLTTSQCFKFLLDCAQYGRHLLGFYCHYDVSMMLNSLIKSDIDKLNEDGKLLIKISTGYYSIEFIPHKILTVKWLSFAGTCIQSFKLTDCAGFFQCSFVQACKNWGVTDSIDYFESMKNKRDTFDSESIEEITNYCILECKTLVKLIVILDTHLYDLGIKLRSYHGAGAIATELFALHKTLPYHVKDDSIAVKSAYFGGRIQNLKVGMFEGVYNYDINSAYPSTLADVPGLIGELFLIDNEPEINERYLYKIRFTSSLKITPFPVRLADNSIEYPATGIGYYYGVEIISAAIPGNEIAILETWAVKFDNSKPFDFINELYDKRAELKRAGNLANIVIKLGLNSMYGKMAQRRGKNQMKEPKYKSFYIAGYITAHCRARLYKIATQNIDSVLAFCTDGIMSLEPLKCECNKLLGGFEADYYEAGTFIQPGFYRLKGLEGDKAKTRGVSGKKVDWDEIERVFQNEGVNGEVIIDETRFIAFTGNNLSYNRWVAQARVISFYPVKGVLQGESDIYPIDGNYAESLVYDSS